MQVIQRNGDLKLRNDGDLEIFFLGTGTPFSKQIFNNNFIIIKGNTHILVDFGFTGPEALRKFTNLKPTDFECILPTHSHSDHIGGLEYLLLSKRYFSKEFGSKFDIIITDEYKDLLWNRSLKGGLEWNEITNSHEKLNFDSYFNQKEPILINKSPRKHYNMEYGEIKLEIFLTNHIPPSAKTTEESFISYGMLIDNKILMTCDTKFDKGLIDQYKDRFEFIFHDCSLEKNPVHSCLTELRGLDQLIKDKMYLMHYDDNYEKYNASEFAGFAEQGNSYIFD